MCQASGQLTREQKLNVCPEMQSDALERVVRPGYSKCGLCFCDSTISCGVQMGCTSSIPFHRFIYLQRK